MSKRRPATRPAPRTVAIAITEGDFAGWEATARADFPARFLVDLQSGSIEQVMAVLDAIIVDHNFPTEQDKLAASMRDVDPYTGLLKVAGDLLDAIATLPNR